MSHPIVHIELSAENHQEMANWYGEVFGWKSEAYPDMNYSTFKSGEDSLGGGFNPITEEAPAGTVVVYINCDDINEMVSKIEANGGKVVVPPMPIPTVGQIAQFIDPSGNLMAVIQPEEGGM